ncbi:sodium/proton antiporter NhaB [Salmonella enterica subsp. enterica]|nr:sodium/proton antiporter NhaB [Salmonella enterica subsp. enterica]
MTRLFIGNFLGCSPNWYKFLIVLFLLVNPVLFYVSPFLSAWFLVGEFIVVLAMALKCYPLFPGGLLAIEAIFIGMTDVSNVRQEILVNVDVLLLLMFMVAGVSYIKDLLLYFFSRLLLSCESKLLLSVLFCTVSAILSAFLDALTVIAVLISVIGGFYTIYCEVSEKDGDDLDLEVFRAFLRSLMMHAGIGSALGGVLTIVGEPQNLIIAKNSGWGFGEFFFRMLPVTLPVFLCGILTCLSLEKIKIFGYGVDMPSRVRRVLRDYSCKKYSKKEYLNLILQGGMVVWLVSALALHLAEVGLIGLSVIILAASVTGSTDEHSLGKAFTEAMPFAALLVVFFVIISVIVEQKLFIPVIHYIFNFSSQTQVVLFYIFSGVLSMVSDNVFVGSVYINEVKNAFDNNLISLGQFENLAVAINTGTNLPSIATPSGQAAFLFLLTSRLATMIKFSYGKMVWMALPYTVVIAFVGLFSLFFFLPSVNEWMVLHKLIANHHP